MSRSGLTEPSQSLADYVCAGFAILGTRKDLLLQYSEIRKQVSLLTLELLYANPFMCNDHQEWGRKLVNSIITNIFFNNEQSIKMQTFEMMELLPLKPDQTKLQEIE